MLSHHVVIKNGKIIGIIPIHLHPGTPTRAIPTARRVPTKTPSRTLRSSRKTGGINLKASISCARRFAASILIFPGGVHMYDGGSKILETRHSPMFGSKQLNNSYARTTRVPATAEVDRDPACKEIESTADPNLRICCTGVGAVGEGPPRGPAVAADVGTHPDATGDAGRKSWSKSWSRDDLVASLLVLYGLHPLDLETRVAQALNKGWGSRLHALDGKVEFLNTQRWCGPIADLKGE